MVVTASGHLGTVCNKLGQVTQAHTRLYAKHHLATTKDKSSHKTDRSYLSSLPSLPGMVREALHTKY